MPSFKSLPLRYEHRATPLKFQSTTRGTITSVYPVRIITEIRVHIEGETPKPVECLVDTGAPLSVFPKGTWSDHWVDWLKPVNVAAVNSTNAQGLSSQSLVSAQVGLIEISVLGIASGKPPIMVESPPFTIMAKFLKDDAPHFQRILLGIEALQRWSALEVDFEVPATSQLRGIS